MDAKELKDHLHGISSFLVKNFDRDAGLADLAFEVVKEPEGRESRECALVDICLAIGFTVGHLFETVDPETRNHLDAIKTTIRDRGSLPFLPRERKSQATLTK